MRVAIAGVPGSGKTTLSERVVEKGGFIFHTDNLIGQFDWSELSAAVAKEFDKPGPWIVEGVAVIRAARKWLLANPDGGKPFDKLIWLPVPLEPYSKQGHKTMAKGVRTVFEEIRKDLVARGVEIEVFKHDAIVLDNEAESEVEVN